MKPEVPEGVGPHEGRELELMLAGRKPAAMFGDAAQFRDIIPEEDFAPHVAAGRIIKREYYGMTPHPATASLKSSMRCLQKNGASMRCVN